jgi:hypothetical protein
MADTLSPDRQRTAAARAAFAASFESPEAKTAHYRALARKAAEGRIVLPADDARAFIAARDELTRLVEIVARIADRVERQRDERARPSATTPHDPEDDQQRKSPIRRA